MTIPPLYPTGATPVAGIIDFLKKEPAIQKMNFEFSGIRIWPGAYTDHIVRALSRGDIRCAITYDIEEGASGAYNPETDTFKMRPGFDITQQSKQALAVHELTHAFLDLRAMTGVGAITSEAVSYLAHAVFLEVNSLIPLGNVADILLAALPIAQNTVLTNKYTVSASDVARLEGVVRANPLYAGRASGMFLSNGFTRSTGANIRRALTGREVR